jgi:hypothetical protein
MRKKHHIYSLDPDVCSDPCSDSASSVGLHYADNESYDEWGQARWGGIGQGTPHDENGRYLYSQVGNPVVPSPPLVNIPKIVDEGLETQVLDHYC